MDLPDDQVPSDWDNSSLEDFVSQTKCASKVQVSKVADKFKIPEWLQHELPNVDDERRRLEKVQRLNSRALGQGLFGDEEESDSLESFEYRAKSYLASTGAAAKAGQAINSDNVYEYLEVDTFARMQALVNALRPKIEASHMQSAAYLNFANQIMILCATKMNSTNLNTLAANVKKQAESKLKEENLKANKSKKNHETLVRSRDPMYEMRMRYGSESGSDDDYSEDY